MPETRLIDGRALAARVRAEAAAAATALPRPPGLAAVLVGDDPASHLYVRIKERACKEAGIAFETRLFPADANEGDVRAAIRELNAAPGIDAILVQLPLPAHLDEHVVIAELDPEKDVDGFHPATIRAFLDGKEDAPVLARAILALIEASGAPKGGRAAVIGNSAVFVEPVAALLAREGFETETAVDPEAAEEIAKRADAVVIAVGRPGWLGPEHLKPGAAVIDVGTTRLADGTIVGDADAARLEGVASAITPVPGGVGPVTVAFLLQRTVELSARRQSA